MDFDDLQALLWAHEHGSLQSASRASGVSRATLRRRLERLDATIGRPTHVTGPEGITLTRAGHALVTDGHQLLHARQRLLDRVARGHGTSGSLRVLVQVGLPPRAIASVLAAGTQLLEGVAVHLEFDADPASRAGEAFDAIVHWGAAPVVRSGFTRTLLRARFHVQGSADYLATHGLPQTPDDLAGHRILHLAGTDPAWPCLSGPPVAFTPAHSCADLYVLGMLAGQGLGLALLPVDGPMLDPMIDALVPVLGDHICIERTLRADLPVPTESDSAAAALIRAVERLGPTLRPVSSDG
ncbi:MAG: LysR family transcriptional regulator [Alphaproteobacteria bacterium]|nr:LysR family transcriptional regulator [Alphaproteobacteria bacterium]